MADFLVCYNWTMSDEDAPAAHAIKSDACPEGCAAGRCFAISGINSGAFPSQYAAIADIPQSQRGPAVQSFYQAEFWNQWYAQLASDEVAKRVFDMAVNAGPGTAVELLQRAVNDVAPPLAVDGAWGPNTVAAVNACASTALVAAFQQRRVEYYEAIVARKPADSIYLDGWKARAMK